MRSIKIIIVAIAFLPFLSRAQTNIGEGIRFETSLNWKQIQAKAKAEHKYIFVDCFATWCGPCKYMDKEIFIQKECGDFFNSQFVNVRVQMDATAKDDQHTRDWYADAMTFKAQYQVNSYPCYLFFSPDGVLVHRLSGSREKVKDFISDASEALDAKKQYYTMLAHESEFKNDSIALSHALQTAMTIRDEKSVVLLGKDYLKIKKDLLTKGDILIVCRLINDDKTYIKEGTNFLIKYALRIDAIMADEHFVERIVTSTIYAKNVRPLIVNESFPINWRRISAELKEKYPTLNEQFLNYLESDFKHDVSNEINFLFNSQGVSCIYGDKMFAGLQTRFPDYPPLAGVYLIDKAVFCEDHKLLADCTDAIYTLLKDHGSELSHGNVNGLCWYVFGCIDNKSLLKEALRWEKFIIDNDKPENNTQYINCLDTYANLLYKNSDKKMALVWENKAIEIAMKQNNMGLVKEFKETIEKMEKGEKTWIGVRDAVSSLRWTQP